MPTYDYQCRACNAVTEVIHSMLEDGPTTCERCGGALRRVLFPAGIIFKGPGFYSTDSRSTSSSTNGSGSSASGDSGSGEAGSKPTSEGKKASGDATSKKDPAPS